MIKQSLLSFSVFLIICELVMAQTSYDSYSDPLVTDPRDYWIIDKTTRDYYISRKQKTIIDSVGNLKTRNNSNNFTDATASTKCHAYAINNFFDKKIINNIAIERYIFVPDENVSIIEESDNNVKCQVTAALKENKCYETFLLKLTQMKSEQKMNYQSDNIKQVTDRFYTLMINRNNLFTWHYTIDNHKKMSDINLLRGITKNPEELIVRISKICGNENLNFPEFIK